MKRSLLVLAAHLAAGVSAQPASGPIEAVTIHPPVAAPYQCAEHALGAEDHAGDALGADCMVVRRDGGPDGQFASFHTGDGTRNEDWHSWNETLLAPFDGVVTLIYLNPHTTVPGVWGEGRSSAVLFRRTATDGGAPVQVGYVHVQDVLVAEGDTVTAGQPVARIGNNGSSWYPHLHIGAFRGELFSDEAVPLQIRMDLEALGRLRGTLGPALEGYGQ